MKTKIFITWILLLGCLFNMKAQQRIIGGQTIDISQAPYQVCIFVTDITGQNGYGDGFLISDQWILTAAHVVRGFPLSNVKVSMGHNNPNTDTNRKSVSNIIFHTSADIALVKLASPVTFTDNIAPIYISNARNYAINTSCEVAGWGQTFEGELTEIPNNQLKRSSLSIQSISNEEIVAVASSDGAPYSGDSGSALVMERIGSGYKEAIGVYNGRPKNTDDPDERIFTNISSCYNWIASYVDLYSLSGPGLMCSSGVFTASMPSGTLQLGPGLQKVSQSGDELVVQASFSGRTYIRIMADDWTILQKYFWCGAPAVTGITYDGQYLSIVTAGGDAGVTRTEWTIGSDRPHVASGSTWASPYTSGTRTVSVTATNDCGTSLPYQTVIDFAGGTNYAITVAARVITVTPVSDGDDLQPTRLSSAPAGSLNYMLVNMNTGTVAANGSISAAGGTIDCANLPNGLYALKLFTPDGTEQAFKITLR